MLSETVRRHPSPAAIYDGDTTSYRRKKIREKAPPILITNPDMLHLGLIPYHAKWTDFFAGLRYVVVDEVHTYRGVFGSHVAWVMRRFKRICALYGAHPTFILASATIGNPGEHARLLIDAPTGEVTHSGASRAARHVLLINPLDSAATTATLMLEAAVSRGLRTIVYCQSRKMIELITIWTEQRLKGQQDLVASYRSGFLPEERREIEARLAEGSLLGVITTSALELGIDIGHLDICLLVGYPGPMMATWQRAGRGDRNPAPPHQPVATAPVRRRQHLVFTTTPTATARQPARRWLFLCHPRAAGRDAAWHHRRLSSAATLSPGCHLSA